MKPFKYQAGGIIGQWASNENCVIKVLPYYEKDLSEKKYRIEKVREFGLLVRHDCKAGASSPDGILPLLEQNKNGSYDFISLCVLETKTRGSENTIDALTMEVENNGVWVECNAGTPLF